MPLPVITFNSSTGSDTAASGSGGTAITAGGNNGAATTAASADVDLSADAPDLSSLASPTGAEVLWVDTASGIQWAIINSVNNTTKVVTCAATFAGTASGLNWGIGGKRATIDNVDSRKITQNGFGAAAGWTVRLEDNQSITTNPITMGVANLIIEGDSLTSHRQILQTSNVGHISFSASFRLRNIKFANSNGTKTSAFSLSGAGTGFVYAMNCIFGDVTNTLNTVLNRVGGTPNLYALNCEVCYLTTSLQLNQTTIGEFTFENCWIHDCVSHGVAYSADSANGLKLLNCIIEDNGGDGINVSTTAVDGMLVSGCTIDGNTGDGIDMSTASVGQNTVIKNCNITGNGGYGINGHSTLDLLIGWHDYNNYGTGGTANTSGARNNLTAGTNDLAVDPSYTNVGSNNFSVGTSVAAKGYPVGGTTYLGANKSATYSYVDIGAAQRVEASGSSGEPSYAFIG